MPKLPEIQTPELAALPDQLRFTPRPKLVRTIELAEELVENIDASRRYPLDWLVFRLTEFPSETGTPRLITGESVLRDLSALVEHLCERVLLQTSEIEEGSLTAADLSERWSVSEKTLQRYRRSGLIARRVRSSGRRVSLVFTRRVVEAFEARESSRIERARTFSRLDEHERAQARDKGAELRATGLARTVVAAELADQLGRSGEGVRLVLGHEFPDWKGATRLSKRAKSRIARAVRDGASPSSVASSAGCSRATVHRVANVQRAVEIRDVLTGSAIRLPQEASDEGADAVLVEDAVCFGLGGPTPEDADAFVRAADATDPVGADIERARAQGYLVLVARAERMLLALSRSQPRAAELDRIETDLRWAGLLKVELVRSLQPLVVRTVRERSTSADQLPEMLTKGMTAAIMTPDRHDPWRGGRLAGAAAIEIARSVAQRRRHSGATLAWRERTTPWWSLLMPHHRARMVAEGLSREAFSVVGGRYGWDFGHPRTVLELEQQLGCGRARIAAILRSWHRSVSAAEHDRDSHGTLTS